MKKIISLLCALCCLFLVSCKKDKIKKSTEEKEPIQTATENMNNKEIIGIKNEEDENKKNILRILYSQDVKGIMWYFRFEANPVKIENKKLEISDEYKEKFANNFFKKYFSEDIEMQEKLQQLPLSYRYYIYKELK